MCFALWREMEFSLSILIYFFIYHFIDDSNGYLLFSANWKIREFYNQVLIKEFSKNNHRKLKNLKIKK
ncbi:unnamed protein product [Blepharisma stoltei]|uniref:Uncharacterized protein n=1 Tax=Blepharisma stoltei TaxID=1481888 RepID=A0AAU9JSI9_9CILI|nr:unnamed protein product [Blepharisma stoltei]